MFLRRAKLYSAMISALVSTLLCNQPSARDSQTKGSSMCPQEMLPNKRGPGKYPSILTLGLLTQFYASAKYNHANNRSIYDKESRCFSSSSSKQALLNKDNLA